MQYSLRVRIPPDILLGMSGAILMILGFFLPLLFSQPLGSEGFTFSQWDMVRGWWEFSQHASRTHTAWMIAMGLFILAGFALPLLTAPVGLLAFCLTIIRKQPVPSSARWMLYATGAGAVLELLVISATFYYFRAWQFTQITSGFILLVVGSLLLLSGILVGRAKRNIVLSEL
jgi:hypothetical protein